MAERHVSPHTIDAMMISPCVMDSLRYPAGTKGPQATKLGSCLNSSTTMMNNGKLDVTLELGDQKWFSEARVTRDKSGLVDDHKEE
jgi:hypothetical protein